MTGWRVGESGWERDSSDEFLMSDVEFALFLDGLDPLALRHSYHLSLEEEQLARRLHYQQLLRSTQRNTSSRP
jgi:hypothetical protein